MKKILLVLSIILLLFIQTAFVFAQIKPTKTSKSIKDAVMVIEILEDYLSGNTYKSTDFKGDTFKYHDGQEYVYYRLYNTYSIRIKDYRKIITVFERIASDSVTCHACYGKMLLVEFDYFGGNWNEPQFYEIDSIGSFGRINGYFKYVQVADEDAALLYEDVSYGGGEIYTTGYIISVENKNYVKLEDYGYSNKKRAIDKNDLIDYTSTIKFFPKKEQMIITKKGTYSGQKILEQEEYVYNKYPNDSDDEPMPLFLFAARIK